jgi:hypothetical protein
VSPVGGAADLVIFDGNPLESPELLWAPGRRSVIAGGRLLSGG